MLKSNSPEVLYAFGGKVWTDKSAWTYDCPSTSIYGSTITIYANAATIPAVADFVSLNPNGGGFPPGIYRVLTVNGATSFTVSADGPSVAVTGGTFTSTSDLPVLSFTIPAGTLKLNSMVKITGRISTNGSANLKTIKSKLDGSNFHVIGVNNAAVVAGIFESSFHNRNSYTKQIGTYNDTSQSGSYTLVLGVGGIELTKDTKLDTTLSITFTKTATDNMILDGVTVVHFPFD